RQLRSGRTVCPSRTIHFLISLCGHEQRGDVVSHASRANERCHLQESAAQFLRKYEGKTATVQDFEQMAIALANSAARPNEGAPNLAGYFAQWMNSTGIPEFMLEYVTYRTRKGFRVVGKIHQPIDTFSMPVQIRIDTEGNPEIKWIDAQGLDSEFMVETFGRPKP